MSRHEEKEHKDLHVMEFLDWSKEDGTSVKVLAVGIATEADLLAIAQEEQDASFEECLVVATLEQTRTGKPRVNYL